MANSVTCHILCALSEERNISCVLHIQFHSVIDITPETLESFNATVAEEHESGSSYHFSKSHG